MNLHELFVDVHGVLSRVTCDLIVGQAASSEMLSVIRTQADRLGQAASPDAVSIATALRVVVDATPGDAEALCSTLDDVIRALEALCLSAVEAPAAPATTAVVDVAADELEVLRADGEIANLFISEALDHLGTIESTLLALEERPGDRELLNDIFRPFHTIKGNAGALGITSLQAVAHRVENLLDLIRSGRHPMGQAEADVVLHAVDVCTLMITDIDKRLKGEPPADLAEAAQALMGHVERLIAGGAAVEAPAIAAGTVSSPRGGNAPAQTSIKVDTRKLDNLVDAVGELIIVQSLIHEDPALAALVDGKLARNLSQLKRITGELQRGAMGLRMVPVRQAFQKVARIVRDLGKSTGKPVELVLAGEDTELDRKVVEEITDPLMHMVRNSIDHGIEPPAEREAAGKRAQGRISLAAYHQGGHIVLEIADDGAGLNTEKIREIATARGLLNAHDTPADADVHALIFAPGFSTAEKVTEISGRGVGMDVVRRNIEALRGRIEIRSERGRGTTFVIKLPLTLAVLDGLLVSTGGERFVLPANAVRESLRPSADQIHAVAGQPRLVKVRDTLLPLAFLGELFGLTHTTNPAEATVVVLEDDGERLGVVVDELLNKQEVVIKSLGETFASVRGVAGGAILGDGRIGLILDAHGIVELMRGERRAA